MASDRGVRHVLTLRCADRPGIVAAVAAGILELDGNIVDSAQFGDPVTGLFCLRTCFEAPSGDASALLGHLSTLDGAVAVRREDRRARVAVLVSRLDHCLVDLLYRWETGELPVDIVGVVSNHPDLSPLAARHGVAFRHIPVTAATKAHDEAVLVAAVEDLGGEVVVLARYMQVLSPGLCERWQGAAINIHHSFLPGFVGARPHQRAYERGVKLIGATAHYVTADLDQGPIIDQDVVRVGHTHTAADLAAMGRDVERTVLARALRLHVEDRVVLAGSRTVVFGP